MSRKAFTMSLLSLALLGGTALLILYMTLGRIASAISPRPPREAGDGERVGVVTPEPRHDEAVPRQAPAGQAPPAQEFQGMTLTPAGRLQLEMLERQQVGPVAKPAGTAARPSGAEANHDGAVQKAAGAGETPGGAAPKAAAPASRPDGAVSGPGSPAPRASGPPATGG